MFIFRAFQQITPTLINYLYVVLRSENHYSWSWQKEVVCGLGVCVHLIVRAKDSSLHFPKLTLEMWKNLLESESFEYYSCTRQVLTDYLPNSCCTRYPNKYSVWGDIYCGASSQADFILNYFLSNFLTFPQTSSQIHYFLQAWLAGWNN